MFWLKLIFLFIGLALALIVLQYVIIRTNIQKVNLQLQPWQHAVPGSSLKVLFSGDSTAVGTGLDDNTKSTAGYFGHDHPDADVENHSYNGLRLAGEIQVLSGLQDKHYDLAILQIGANDIINLTPLAVIKNEQRQVLDLAKHIARHVVILHCGNLGESGMFIWPLNWLYTWRSLKVRDIYLASQDTQVAYVDIYALNQDRDFRDCYAKDHLHLNSKGYYIWYSYIKGVLQQRGWA